MGPQDSTLPLFPLETPVLLPRIRIPLHVFEPRYRKLVRDLLERDPGQRQIGMATVRPEHLDEIGGDPPLFDVGCAGRLVEIHPRVDGRFDCVLQGERRFRILEEGPPDPARPYRLARVEYLDEADRPEDGPRIEALRLRVLEHVAELAPPARRSELARLRHLDAPLLANLLAFQVVSDPVERQGLVEADGTLERLDRLEALLRFRIAGRTGGVLPRDRKLH